jgi:hypothetical protein
MITPPPQPGMLYPGQKPAVLVWYKVYLAFMIALMVLVVGVGVFLFFAPIPPEEFDGLSKEIMGGIYIALGIIFAIPPIIALFLPKRPWVWIYHLVMICLGMTGCTIVASIPLLIFWIKPEVKAYFNNPD